MLFAVCCRCLKLTETGNDRWATDCKMNRVWSRIITNREATTKEMLGQIEYADHSDFS